MQIAATMAGWAFTIAQTALAHGMAHTVGTLHHVHHGAACGILIPKVMRYNVDHAADKLALVAQALGVNITGMAVRDAALAAADAVEALMKDIGTLLSSAKWVSLKRIFRYAPSTRLLIRQISLMRARSMTRPTS